MPSIVLLEQAYLAHRARLLRFFAARGAGDAAEDLLQELWLRLAGASDTEAAASLGFMMRAADRLMIDRYRSQRQAQLRDKAWSETQPGLGDNVALHPEAERIIGARQQVLLIDRALAELGERTATIFRRHRIEGIPQRQIAAEMGVSISTVESDLRRAYMAITDLRSMFDEG